MILGVKEYVGIGQEGGVLDSGHDFYKVIVGMLTRGWGRWQGQWEAERRRLEPLLCTWHFAGSQC